MIKVGLIKEKKEGRAWHDIILTAFDLALSSDKENRFIVTKLNDYPKDDEFFDFIIVVGIKLVAKNIFNSSKLKKHCNYLIDMGDRGDDPRVGSEDGYFYFVPSANKTKQNCFYIPKFVNEDHLFLGQNNDKLTIFVDHYTRCQPKEMDLSVRAIKEVFRQLSTAEVPLRIFYPTSKGVEIDPKEPEIADKSIKEIYKQIPFSEIAKYYRQTHIFFPTHRETQGMVAQEIGACGGITLMQEWMYPQETHYQFPHFLYIPGQKINFTKIQEYIFMDDVRKKIRTHVLKNCGFDLFKNILIKTIINLK